MVVINFFHNVTNNQQNPTRSLILGTCSVGFIRPTVTSKPILKILLALLVLCWLLLTNISKPLNREIEVYLLAVGSFFVGKYIGGYYEE